MLEKEIAHDAAVEVIAADEHTLCGTHKRTQEQQRQPVRAPPGPCTHLSLPFGQRERPACGAQAAYAFACDLPPPPQPGQQDVQRVVRQPQPACDPCQQREVALDEDYLDEIAAAFGQVVDSKSPYTAGHSGRVALYTDIIAAQMGLSESRRRWLKRGALLHDVGKLGVSNAILDKPDKLNAQEWAAVQMHAAYTEEILSRIGAFEELAQVAGAHHERLDGKGYPKGLSAADIALETRIITTADIFDAITAKRPYRGAIPVPQALEMMAEHLGTAIDPDCFAALQAGIRDFSIYLSPEQPLAQAG